MSVYSRCVEARGTMTIESTPAWRQPSKPVFRSRFGSGASEGEPGEGLNDDPFAVQYGWTLKPYSDWTPSPGTTGLGSTPNMSFLPAVCLSRATTASTRRSTPWTWDTPAAPSEWPTMPTFAVRPGVAVSRSG